MTTLNNFQDIILVSIGAVLGANVRFLIYQKFEEININRYYIILFINSFSSFLLGLFVSVLSNILFLNFTSQLVLIFSIGFLGSLSTFSTFVYDLFNSSLKIKFFRALKSLSLGIISVGLGLLLSN